MEKVTACLITWKRQQNIPRIIDNLLKNSFIDEIIIRDNSKCENIINYGRYTSALKAKNNFIFTQDDDCIVENLGDMYEKFLEDTTRLCHGGPEYYKEDMHNNIFGATQMSLMGWGSFFDKRWIPVLDQYINVYGKDYCFYRETDRIFSILLGKHSTFFLADVKELLGNNDKDALSQAKEHLDFKKLAISRALKLYESNHSDTDH